MFITRMTNAIWLSLLITINGQTVDIVIQQDDPPDAWKSSSL